MAGPFGATSTTDDVLSGKDLSGKRVLVTGVSAGLGVETARALAAHGAQVVGAARDLAKAKRATAEVRAQAANGGGLELVELDLASLESVRACADAQQLFETGRSLPTGFAGAARCFGGRPMSEARRTGPQGRDAPPLALAASGWWWCLSRLGLPPWCWRSARHPSAPGGSPWRRNSAPVVDLPDHQGDLQCRARVGEVSCGFL